MERQYGWGWETVTDWVGLGLACNTWSTGSTLTQLISTIDSVSYGQLWTSEQLRKEGTMSNNTTALAMILSVYQVSSCNCCDSLIEVMRHMNEQGEYSSDDIPSFSSITCPEVNRHSNWKAISAEFLRGPDRHFREGTYMHSQDRQFVLNLNHTSLQKHYTK